MPFPHALLPAALLAPGPLTPCANAPPAITLAPFSAPPASQRSLHNAPIFRLLLKVAVNGTHQCDFLNFCGPFGVQQLLGIATTGHAGAICEENFWSLSLIHI